MLRPWLFVGFSGHRKLDDPVLIARTVRAAMQRLAAQTQAPLAAVSSAAAGADTIFAELVVEKDLPWTLLLPFPVEEFGKDFANDPQAWARVERLLPHAVRTVVEPTTDVRTDAYLEAGVRTVDECDVLLAVWNGEPAAGTGGTADVIDYARSQRTPLIWIHSETGKITEEHMEHLPAASDAGRDPAATGPMLDGRAQLEAALRHDADAASRLRPRAVNLNLTLVVLHQLTVAVTLTMLIWWGTWFTDPAGQAKIVLLMLALILPWFLRRAHDDWLNHRLRAEIFRSAATVWPLPNPEDILPGLRLPVEERLQRSILLLRLLTPTPAIGLAQAREAYGTERVDQQLEYFHTSARAAARRQRWLTRLGLVCTLIAIVVGLPPALGWLDDSMALYRPLRNLGYVLPLATTAMLAAVAARDLSRRAARYSELADFLRRARTQLQHARTWTRLTRIVTDVERTLLLEVWEWYALARFAPKG